MKLIPSLLQAVRSTRRFLYHHRHCVTVWLYDWLTNLRYALHMHLPKGLADDSHASRIVHGILPRWRYQTKTSGCVDVLCYRNENTFSLSTGSYKDFNRSQLVVSWHSSTSTQYISSSIEPLEISSAPLGRRHVPFSSEMISSTSGNMLEALRLTFRYKRASCKLVLKDSLSLLTFFNAISVTT